MTEIKKLGILYRMNRYSDNMYRKSYPGLSRNSAMPHHQIDRTIRQSLRLRNETLQEQIQKSTKTLNPKRKKKSKTKKNLE